MQLLKFCTLLGIRCDFDLFKLATNAQSINIEVYARSHLCMLEMDQENYVARSNSRRVGNDNLISLFSSFFKYYHIMIIIIVFWLGNYSSSWLIFFVPALLLSVLTPLFLPSLSVFLSYLIFAVPMREGFWEHSCMSPPSYSHTEWNLFSRNELII